jgi:flavin-dependent dehydrogenase
MVSAYNIEVNVLIVGAGPAGTTLSLFLSEKKISHLIIDKAIFPRDKVCGDALSGKVMDVLRKLDKNISEEINSAGQFFTGSYGVKFAAPNGKFIDIPFKKDLGALSQPPGFISKRTDFDHFLFQKIDRKYATVIENCSIKDIERKNNGVECL